jgi:hypothetical protein
VKLSVLRPARNIDAVSIVDPVRAEPERQVRQARLDLARRQPAWTEIPETRLVRRGPFLVDAETDLVYVRRRGVVFEPGRANVGYIRESTGMTYTVDQADNIVFLEQPGRPSTAHSAAASAQMWRARC